MKQFKITTVIPTYKRVKDLNKCLDSILKQTIKPFEVLVIDNANHKETKDLIMNRKINKIHLKYIANKKENSLSVAKNIAIKSAKGNIISFLDDDIVLTKKYNEEILKTFEEKNAIGVTGQVIMNNMSKITPIRNLLRKKFYLGMHDDMRILPSFYANYYLGHDTIKCEWLSGASTWKKEIFKDMKFDEKLKLYSRGEDSDFSFRAFKKYPTSLYMNPNAKYFHNESQGGLPSKQLAYMKEVHGLYLFYKNIEQTITNKLIFGWSRVGLFVLALLFFFRSPGKNNLLKIKHLLGAFVFARRHRKEIKRKDLSFFNRTLNTKVNM